MDLRRRVKEAALYLLLIPAVVLVGPGTALAARATTGVGAGTGVRAEGTGSTSVVNVSVGGDRVSTSAIGPLAGVQLGLYAAQYSISPINNTWARCTSLADGICTFTVPETGIREPNAGARFYVKQLPGGVPAGWFTNPMLRTGNGSGSNSTESLYAFQTPALHGGGTYSSTSNFMYSTDYQSQPYVASNGIWQQSGDNPALPAKCGLDVALVLDLSASVGSALPQLKQAADTFADALVGTPSRMAVFDFDAKSPSSSVGENLPALVPVSTQGGANAFKAQYAGWTLGKGTNWDQGLYAVASASPHYELTVVLTDGNPTYSGYGPTGDGSNTHFSDVEGGIFSANAVKAKGTRVIAMGVGKGVVGSSYLNLRAISGPDAFDGTNYAGADYYQTDDFETAGYALHKLALSRCDNSLSIVKQIVPEGTTGEDVTGAQPAGAGWTFTAQARDRNVSGGLPATETTSSDGTGSVSFEPVYREYASGAEIEVTEHQQEGYELVTQDGADAVCTDLDNHWPLAVTNRQGADGEPAFSVYTPRGSSVSCTVYNRPVKHTGPPPPNPPKPTHPHGHGALAGTGVGGLGGGLGRVAGAALLLTGCGVLMLLLVRRRRPIGDWSESRAGRNRSRRSGSE